MEDTGTYQEDSGRSAEDIMGRREDEKEVYASSGSSNENTGDRTQKLQQKRSVELCNKNLESDEIPTKKKRAFDDENVIEEYVSQGLKSSLPGITYQLKLLMLFLRRGLKNGYNFQLATEITEAGKFDDVVFKYEDKDTKKLIYRFLQAKHLENESKKINVNDFFAGEKGKFSLQKYFRSYITILQNPKFFGERIEPFDFVICTNIDLDEKLKENSFEPVTTKDDILDHNRIKEKQPKRFKLKATFDFKPKLELLFEESSKLVRLAKKLASYLKSQKRLDFNDELLREFHKALANKVINVNNIRMKKSGKIIKRYAKFHDIFLSTELSEEILINFRNEFRIAYLGKDNEQKNINIFLRDIETKEFLISEAFGKVFVPKNIELTGKDLQALVEKFANAMIKSKESAGCINIQRKPKIISRNIDKLAGYVLVKKDDEKDIYRFSSAFLDNQELPGNLKTFRSSLKTQLKSMHIDLNLQKYKFKIADFITCHDGQFNAEPLLPHDYITKAHVKGFLEKIVFAVNQPNEVELGDIIEDEMSKDHYINMIDTDIMAYVFEKFVLDWMKEKKARFLSRNEGEDFFNFTKHKISYLNVNQTFIYRALIKKSNFKFNEILNIDNYSLVLNSGTNQEQQNKIIIKVKNLNDIFNLDIMGQHTQILMIYTKTTLLTAVKIYHLVLEDKRVMFTNLNDLCLLSLSHELDPVKIFEQKCYLIIKLSLKPKKIGNKLLKKIFQYILGKPNKRLIIIASKKLKGEVEYLLHSIQNPSRIFKELDDNINFFDLTQNSQIKLHKKKISFLGKEICLDKLLQVDYNRAPSLIDGDILTRLLFGRKIEVGCEPKDAKYDEVKDYYISRTLFRHSKLKDQIKNDSSVYITSNSNQIDPSRLHSNQNITVISDDENDFSKLCENPVYKPYYKHLLKADERDLFWQHSTGNLSFIREFIDKSDNSAKVYKTNQIIDLKERMVIITAEPGIGKSIMLSHLALNTVTKSQNELLWIARINLVDHATDYFDELEKENISVDKKYVALFLLKAMKFAFFKINKCENVHDLSKFVNDNGEILLNSEILTNTISLHTSFEVKLFNIFYQQGKIAILLDGFDEIYPNHKKKVIELLRTLKHSNVKKIWLTTRPCNTTNELEDMFRSFSYAINPLEKSEQEELLFKYWEKDLDIKLDTEKFKKFLGHLRKNIIQPIDNSLKATRIGPRVTTKYFRSTIIDKHQEMFMNFPLHIKMISKVYLDEFVKFCCGQSRVEIMKRNFNFAKLYKRFFEIKFDEIAYSEKSHIPNKADPRLISLLEGERQKQTENHKKIALLELFKDQIKPLFSDLEYSNICELKDNYSIYGTGIIFQVESYPRFIHRSFAEYFAAKFLADILMDLEHEKYDLAANFLYENFVELCMHNSLVPLFLNYELVGDSKLHIAALSGDIQGIKALKTESVNNKINECDCNGRTPLHLASYNGNLDIVKLLLKNGADITFEDKIFKWTPFHFALAKEKIDIVNHFLSDKNIRKIIETRDRYDRTCFSLAAQADVTFFFSVLCTRIRKDNVNIDINCKDKDGKTPLHLFIEHKGDSALSQLLVLGADSNAQDRYGRTPLHYAIGESSHSVLYKLLLHGANPGIKDEDNNSPLEIAYKKGLVDISSMLIRKMLNDGNESTVSDYIYNKYHKDFLLRLLSTSTDVASFLLKEQFGNTVDINATDADGLSALHYTVIKQDINLIDFLLKEGAKVNIEDNQGKTPLQYICSSKEYRTETIQSLLIRGALLDVTDNNYLIHDILKDIRKLFLHVENNEVTCVKDLLQLYSENNAFVNCKNSEGRTPLHIAVEKNITTIVQLLLDYGAFYNVTDKNGITPLALAGNNIHTISQMLTAQAGLFVAIKEKDKKKIKDMLSPPGIFIDPAKFTCINSAEYYRGMRPLHIAIEFGTNTEVELILKNNPKLNVVTIDKSNIFHLAVQKHHPKMLQTLLNSLDPKTLRDIINNKNVDGEAPLHVAARKGNKTAIRALLEKGADINTQTLCYELTPLHIVAESGNCEIAECLLEHNAEILQSFFGSSPLDVAIKHDNINIAEIIVKMRPESTWSGSSHGGNTNNMRKRLSLSSFL